MNHHDPAKCLSCRMARCVSCGAEWVRERHDWHDKECPSCRRKNED